MEILPEWTQAIPEGWESRLRQISPIAERTSHLRFRWRAKVSQWELYACTPKSMLSPERVEQLTVHWSELPKSQQHGRKQFVTEYQHYMFRTYGVEAQRFWVLQGELGGTPAVYTYREERLLQAVGAPDDPPPLGHLEACPFDERAVQAIQARDRLMQAGGDLDALEKQNTSQALQSEDSETEREFRKAFLKWWFVQMIPNSEFMKTYLRTKSADTTLRRATKAEADAATQFADHFVETGQVIGATHAGSRIVVPGPRQIIAA